MWQDLLGLMAKATGEFFLFARAGLVWGLLFRGPGGPGRSKDLVKEVAGEAPHLFDKVPGPPGDPRTSEKQPPNQPGPGV